MSCSEAELRGILGNSHYENFMIKFFDGQKLGTMAEVERPTNRQDYEYAISEMLKIPPDGHSQNGNPYWHSYKKKWVTDVYIKVKELLDNQKEDVP
jgi:hypothetical protein